MPPDPAAVLDDLLSGDPGRILDGVAQVMQTRDAALLTLLSANLDRIEKATTGIDLGGALIPNRVQLNIALRRLALNRDGQTTPGDRRSFCYCRVLTDHILHRPEALRDQGHIVIDSIDVRASEYTTIYRCHCPDCGARFRVQEEIGWHVPTYRWTEIPD